MADLIILGGGCAGLSLAMRLAALGDACPSIIIIEQRSHYQHDRTWCFWHSKSTSMESLVTRKWINILIKDDHDSVTVDCTLNPYQMLESSTFYEEALRVIALNNRIKLVLNTSIIEVPYKKASDWQVATENETYVAQCIIDTRPQQAPKTGNAVLWQSFLGQEISCEHEVFNQDCVTLMDFSRMDFSKNTAANAHVLHSKEIVFTYILPISAERALVEATVFSETPLNQAQLKQKLEAAIITATQGKAYQTIRSEHGILPMGLKKVATNQDKTYINAGLNAGGARPSSGYAFQRIQRWAAACALSIANGALPVAHQADSILLQWMDAIFLKVMQKQPQLAPKLFLAMFKKVNTPSMVRFLSDEGTIKDCLAIILALPPLPFLKQLFVQILPRR